MCGGMDAGGGTVVAQSAESTMQCIRVHGVGGIMVLYENCLQRPNWQPEHAFTIVLKTAMNLTCKNQGFYYDTRGRIKSWSFRSASNVVVHILENQVNLYDSNGVIAVPISTLGDKKRNLPFFCLPIFSLESPGRIGSYYTSLERHFQGEHNAVKIVRNGSELMEQFRKSVLQI